MVNAAHETGVKAPVYITAGWSKTDAYELEHTSDTPKKLCAWRTLCLNDGNGYTEHIYKITEEVCKRYKELDGIFYDICFSGEVCYCDNCLKGMHIIILKKLRRSVTMDR